MDTASNVTDAPSVTRGGGTFTFTDNDIDGGGFFCRSSFVCRNLDILLCRNSLLDWFLYCCRRLFDDGLLDGSLDTHTSYKMTNA